jgi:hypothetical protein
MTARNGAAAKRLAKDPTLCTDDGCELQAVIDGKCIIHAPGPNSPEAQTAAADAEPDPIGFDYAAAMGLAAILLEVTADCLADGGEMTEELLGGMAAVTGMPLDVAAGLLLATTLIARAGELDESVLKAAAERYTQQLSEES